MSNEKKHPRKNEFAAAMLQPFEERAALAIQEAPGDYRDENGFLYCGICHKPKECVTPFGRKVKCTCGCETPHQKAMRENAANTRRSACFHNRTMREWTFEHDNGQVSAIAAARRFVEEYKTVERENLGLLFWGNVGTGKSYAAACIANALIDRGVDAYMTNFARILLELSPSAPKPQRDSFMHKLEAIELLIIDDLGIERNSDFALEIIYTVIDARAIAERPVIITTNLTPDMLACEGNDDKRRIYSRILGMCTPVNFGGKDQRREIGRRKTQIARELLAEHQDKN